MLQTCICTVKPALKATCIDIPPPFTGPQVYAFHANEPVYKEHLCVRPTFCWSLDLSLYTSSTIHVGRKVSLSIRYRARDTGALRASRASQPAAFHSENPLTGLGPPPPTPPPPSEIVCYIQVCGPYKHVHAILTSWLLILLWPFRRSQSYCTRGRLSGRFS